MIRAWVRVRRGLLSGTQVPVWLRVALLERRLGNPPVRPFCGESIAGGTRDCTSRAPSVSVVSPICRSSSASATRGPDAANSDW